MNNEEFEEEGFDGPKPSRTFHQLGILCLDGSRSMKTIGDRNISLAATVNLAVRDFLGYFKARSHYAVDFSIAVIFFDENATVHTPITELLRINDFDDFNPLNGHGGTTYIGSALEKAEELANQFLNDPESKILDHTVRIIVMSDGLCLQPESTKEIAEKLKKNDKITICSTLFTKNGNIEKDELEKARSILLDIASGENFYKTVYGEEDLKQFFITSMSVRERYKDG
jgi:uncharacterized protein YegL